ncbi:unnamed protein product [Meloidogyne enterolobii]|uniref:Uncharacterized protein n=1 Tax=Meloidogyne enterolobii TaxID=390850 RepID=A0ACB1AGL0_MELEN
MQISSLNLLAILSFSPFKPVLCSSSNLIEERSIPNAFSGYAASTRFIKSLANSSNPSPISCLLSTNFMRALSLFDIFFSLSANFSTSVFHRDFSSPGIDS